jgi:AcrR family transcriptional regulator
MARQVRSELTRRKILEAAIDVFGEVGYAAASWGTIIERTGMTKGALYHHFDSKESLASAIIEEGSETLLAAFRHSCGTASPAFENMIHGTFAVARVLNADKTVRAAEQLTAALSGFNDAAAQFPINWVAAVTGEARRAISEGDLREGLDPEAISEAIVGAMFGTRLLATAMSLQGRVWDASRRLRQNWELLLPSIATEASLPYFQQFLAREAMRNVPPAVSSETPEAAVGAPVSDLG